MRGDKILMFASLFFALGTWGTFLFRSPQARDLRSPSTLLTIPGCYAVDGDTLNCRGARIRLNGIDAPEMPGHCRTGRDCAPGDPFAARASLAALVRGTAFIQGVKTDHYGRLVAEVTVGGVDLSCAQLRSGHAVYVSRWDERGIVRRRCNHG